MAEGRGERRMRLVKRTIVWAGLLAAIATLSGCGWTARDDFYMSRSVSLRSRPGDGSEISAGGFRASPTATASGPETASRFDSDR
jgi:hypothetical protein